MEFLNKLKIRAMVKNLAWLAFFGFFGLLMILNAGDDGILVIGICLIVLGIAFVLYPLTGRCQKQMLDKAKEMAPQKPEVVIQCAAQLYQEQKPKKGLRVGYGLVFWENGLKFWLFDIRDICWLYQQTTTTRLYGIIPIGKSYSLLLRTRCGKTITLPITKKQVPEKIQDLKKELPNAIAGYSKEREALYNKDRAQFTKAAAALRAEERSQAPKA